MTKKMSVVATNSMRFGAIIVFFFVMVILNLLSSSSCTQLLKQKGEMEREIAKLDDARMRESTRWEEMKTTENIEAALLRHGLSMHMPRPDQTVRLLPDGTPRPGQLSLAKSKARLNVRTIATMKRSAAPYRRGARAR
ncbi:MAG: hypothetical protein IKC14_02410 [Kiritimatiellae bacterium]|nr:hypothetical protein [Kiritimatiellia bacterium]